MAALDEQMLQARVAEDLPRIAEAHRITVERLSGSFARVTLRFGFMEEPNVPRALTACRAKGMAFDVIRTSFFLARRALRPAPHSPMPRWQDRLFIWLARSANDASRYFGIPSERAVEVGPQIAVGGGGGRLPRKRSSLCHLCERKSKRRFASLALGPG